MLVMVKIMKVELRLMLMTTPVDVLLDILDNLSSKIVAGLLKMPHLLRESVSNKTNLIVSL